ncbi:MauE/DoxX family redox-associated membrane protein [Rhabdothermincola salaria]|uniref:MauE/DoxX family redox-associated membrane protein n=1 Tax=Rhabdothermincola salaria TaxID=2903142 RepID=UPI001E396094|nr:MauE/DoxX family redox-associated membrane protein [Rhabdothermincola salaria]MCD9623882.1 hypothetical protein [Rhabdothermincola salaria]
MVLGGLLGVVAGVLAVGGMAKLRAPAATVPMLEALRLPARPALARLLGAAEVAIGVATYLFGGPWLAAATAVLFVVFTGSVLRLRAAGEAAVSCGCFGASSAPPTLVHAVVDGAAALVAVSAAVTGAPGFIEMRPDLPAAGVAYLSVSFVAVGLGVALLTALPEALVAARRTPGSAGTGRPVRSFSVEAPLT